MSSGTTTNKDGDIIIIFNSTQWSVLIVKSDVSAESETVCLVYISIIFVFCSKSDTLLLFSPPSSTCQLSVGVPLTALCPPLSPTARTGILNVQVWLNLSVAVSVSAVMPILSSLCCWSLYLGMH